MPTQSNLYQFPYSNNQAIISSGGVIVHSKDDTIMLFGKTGVGISTPKEFHVDAPSLTVINSNKIELGLRASTDGSPVLKANETLAQLSMFFDAVTTFATNVATVANYSKDAEWQNLKTAANQLSNTAHIVKGQLNTIAASTVTFTK
jgi:hypothetical protein